MTVAATKRAALRPWNQVAAETGGPVVAYRWRRPCRQPDYCMALTMLLRRLLCRAALFLRMMPLLTMLSMTGTAAL